MHDVGISAMRLYVPSPRVRLADWCQWVGKDAAKVTGRVGRSFRVRTPSENAYTLAANAVLELVLGEGIDPRQVGFLALGTESSGDNSAGAVIVKGMVDDALEALGRPRLARSCEVPEFKHACLGGMYALKAAARWALLDGRGRRAIVVASDTAEYPLGCTGEETQGAGAVAMLVDAPARLLALDLARTGTSSAYRGADFRKPVAARGVIGPADRDWPVFNGRYSTVCYVDAVLRAVEDLLVRTGERPRDFYHRVDTVLMHRPYHRLPSDALAALYLWALAGDDAGHRDELESICREAGVDPATVLAETRSHPDVRSMTGGGEREEEAYPAAMRAARRFRGSPKFAEVAGRLMDLGAGLAADLGNLYTASLPAWIAAALAEARAAERDVAGAEWLLVGYGSGDAADALVARPVAGWDLAASRLGLAEALDGAQDLGREAYEALHAGVAVPGIDPGPRCRFVVTGTGSRPGPGFTDLGIEQYAFRG